jgi:colicin import membrane protein
MSALAFPRQGEPALVRSFALAALVHLLLFGVMFFGVRWQIHRPDTVTVELWDTPPAPPAAPLVAPPPPLPPKVEPAPRIEKPVIALKEKAEKPKPKAEPKPKPAAKPKPDPVFDKRLREQVAQEQKAVEQDRRERALRDLLARQQSDARAQALAAWQDKIRAKIRGNIILPHDLAGNPEAIFDVTLLPSAEVLTVRKRKSSGNMAYDEAVERAILKSSPLPKPEQPSVFERQLELRFRPQDR